MPYKNFTSGVFTNNDVDQYLMSQAYVICTSSTRPTPVRVGMRIWETDLQCERYWTGTEWRFIRGLSIMIIKSADESRSSSASLADDTHLQATLISSATYIMETHLIVSSGSTGDFRVTFNGPAACDITWGPFMPDPDQTQADGVLFGITRQDASSTFDTAGFSSANVVFKPRGVVKTNGTSGTFKMRWSQLVSNATATIVRQNSWIYLRRVA